MSALGVHDTEAVPVGAPHWSVRLRCPGQGVVLFKGVTPFTGGRLGDEQLVPTKSCTYWPRWLTTGQLDGYCGKPNCCAWAWVETSGIQ